MFTATAAIFSILWSCIWTYKSSPKLPAERNYANLFASLTWILAYEIGNGRNIKAIKKSLNTLLSDEYQDKAPSLGFVLLKGDILEKSRAAVKKIGRWYLKTIFRKREK